MVGKYQDTVLFISVDERYSGILEEAVYPRFRLLRCVPHPDKIAQIAKAAAVDLVLVDLDELRWDPDRIEEVIEAVGEAVRDAAVAVACRDISVSTMLPAMRAGATDACDKEAPVEESIAQLEKLLQNRKTQKTKAKGQLVAVLGARRGVGATSLATGLALRLAGASAGGQRTLLFDLGEVPAPTPDILGVTQTYSMTDALRDLGRIDDALIDGAFTSLPKPSLHILPVARNSEMYRATDPSELANLLAVLQTYFGTVVADLNPVSFPALAEHMFLEADRAFLCCDQTLPAIHSAILTLGRLRNVHGAEPKFDLVISRHNRALQPAAQDICKALGHEGAVHIVPDDRLNVDRARNEGRPLVGGGLRSPFSRAVQEIAAKTVLKGEPPEGEPRSKPAGDLWRSVRGRLRLTAASAKTA